MATQLQSRYSAGERIGGTLHSSRYATNCEMYCGKCKRRGAVELESGGSDYLAYDVLLSACCDEPVFQDRACTEIFTFIDFEEAK